MNLAATRIIRAVVVLYAYSCERLSKKDRATRYQKVVPMDTLTLGVLEDAIEPYLRAGYMVTAQSNRAITLTGRQKRFSYLGFILALLLFWPAAVIYLVVHNNRRDRNVCVRLTSDGYLEESGYTFEAAVAERRREQRIILLTTVLSGIFVAVLVLFFTQQG